MVEAGPGDGALTAPLIATAGRVVAIEADRTLYTGVRRRFSGTTNLTLRNGDFLKQRLPVGNYTFFANIPYSRTADIVKKVVLGPAPPGRAFMVMESAAATRFLGRPFGSESALSLMIKSRFELSVVAWLPSHEFSPPSVDSVFLRFVQKQRGLSHHGEQVAFDRFARSVFRSEERSTRKLLRTLINRPQARSLFNDMGLPQDSPPSQIAFEHWHTLFQLSRWNSMEP